ncbi:MAG TPA: FAD-binding protein, partial [Myxococcaceae bacterium]|nr:FAD-binding protein [Myxococcaceae bacterium]
MNESSRTALRALLGAHFEETATGAVLAPGHEREIIQVLRLLAERGERLGPGLSLSRRRFMEVGPIDEKSAVVRAGAGVKLSALEQAVSTAGYTLGPLSPGARARELGDFLEGPYAGRRAIPGGRLEPLCLALEAVTAEGLRYASRPTPRSAAGPD